jgi:hypothetical protein
MLFFGLVCGAPVESKPTMNRRATRSVAMDSPFEGGCFFVPKGTHRKSHIIASTEDGEGKA